MSTTRSREPGWLGRLLKTPLMPPKPFDGARWIFWALVASLVLCYEFTTSKPPHYYPVAALTFALTSCGWEANVRCLAQPFSGRWHLVRRTALRALFNVLSVLFWTILVGFAYALMSPHSTDYTDRSKVTEAILSASAIRMEITQRNADGRALRTIGAGITLTPGGRVRDGTVTEDGRIFLITEDPPAVIQITPRESSTGSRELQWTCIGYPSKYMPATCR